MSKGLLVIIGVTLFFLVTYFILQGQQQHDELTTKPLPSPRVIPSGIAVPIKQQEDGGIQFSGGDVMYPQSINPNLEYVPIRKPDPSPYLDNSTWENSEKPTVTEFVDSWWQRACTDDPTINGCENYR